MPDQLSYVSLLLDLQGPSGSLVIGDGTGIINTLTETLNITCADEDVAQMKIWGDVDTSYNANIQGSEANSQWIDYSATPTIKFSTGDGSKTIYIKLRDDVHNESSVFSATAYVDATLPVVTITSGPIPTKISKQPTKDTAVLVFQCSEDFVEYKVCVVSANESAHTGGTIIPTTAGSLNTNGVVEEGGEAYSANTPVTVTIKGTDLDTASAGSGYKIIKIFCKDAGGNWSV